MTETHSAQPSPAQPELGEMTYDACRLRGNGDSAYDPLASSSSDYTTHQGSHDRKPRDSSPSTSLRREHRDHHDHSVPRRRISPSEMGSTIAERVEQSSSDGVSPELIAAITEKVKREGTFFVWEKLDTALHMADQISSV